MRQFQQLLRRVLVEGDVKTEPRTEVHTIGVSGHQYSVDLRRAFPLHTTRRIFPKFAAEELFWKARGERAIGSLVERGVNYWTANAFQKSLQERGLEKEIPKHTQRWNDELEDYKERLAKREEDGDLGPVYGYQWRHWEKPILVPGHNEGVEWVPEHWEIREVDQLENLLKNLKDKDKKLGRYNILNAWNSADIPDMALGPCPYWHQFTVYGEFLDLHVGQRSCDTFLGVPYNDAQDSILAHMVAREVGLTPRFFYHTFNDVHVYVGVPPRSDFWEDENNIREFQIRVNGARKRDDFLFIRDWYLRNVPDEGGINKGKDHVPDALEQLSYAPKKSSRLELKGIPFMEAIQLPYREVLSVKGYNPHKWKTNSVMAA